MSETSRELLEALLAKDDFISPNAIVNHAESLKRLGCDDELHEKALERRTELLLRALRLGSMRAAVILAKESDGEHRGRLLDIAAARDYPPAVAYIEELCSEAYEEYVRSRSFAAVRGPLTADGEKPFTLKRSGHFDPVKASLTYENGINILRLRVNVRFFIDHENGEIWRTHILTGFKRWEGEYSVFGGQRVKVEIEVDTDGHLYDSILICYADAEVAETAGKVAGKLNADISKAKLLAAQRAFAAVGFKKWRPAFPKVVTLFPKSVVSAKRISDICGHEFGHILGLGDMYADGELMMPGAEPCDDIAPYRLWGKKYRMIMCDENAPVRNNDMEMVLLAFKTGKQQNYQRIKKEDKLSEALGRWN